MRQSAWTLAAGGMIALAAGMGLGRFIYTPILPVMAGELQLSASQAGLIASANYLGYLAGALLATMNRFGGAQRAMLTAGLVLNAAGLAAMAATPDLALHLAIRFAGGLASAFILVFASALVLDRLAAMQRGGLTAFHFGGVGVGIFLSAAVVTGMSEAGGDWRSMWLAGAVLAVAACAGALAFIPAQDAAVRPAGPHRGSGVSPAMRALIAAYGLFGFGYIITATFIVAIVRETPEIRSAEPYIWAAVGLAGVPSVALWMRISRRWGVLRALAAACLVEAAGVAASVLIASHLGIFLAAICLGGTFIAITALGFIAARGLSLGEVRIDMARMTVAFSAGQVIGPVFAGALADATGSYVLPSIVAAAALLAAALTILFGPPKASLDRV